MVGHEREVQLPPARTTYIVYPTIFVVMRSWMKGWYNNPVYPQAWNEAYNLYKAP